MDGEEARRLAGDGVRLLRDVVLVKSLERARRQDVRASLERDFEELDSIRLAPRRFAELIQADVDAADRPGSKAWRTAANKRYQRHGRCLERLETVRVALAEEGRLSEPQAIAVAMALDELRLDATASEPAEESDLKETDS